MTTSGEAETMAIDQLPDHFEVVKELGKGSSGVVVLARDKRMEGKNAKKSLVAIKLVGYSSDMEQNKLEKIIREVYIHGAVENRHIVPVRSCFQTPTHVAIVMEYIEGGDLLDYVQKKRSLAEEEARCIFQQLMYAVRYIHQKLNSMHRDIKLENILVSGSGPMPQVYLCDFSLAKTRGEGCGQTLSMVGTKYYFAPEILLRKDWTRYDGMVADIWSCGVCLYIMLYGIFPKLIPVKKEKHDVYHLKLGGITVDFPRSGLNAKAGTLSSECVSFLERLLQPEPDKRIPMKEIWRDPWFQKHLPRRLK